MGLELKVGLIPQSKVNVARQEVTFCYLESTRADVVRRFAADADEASHMFPDHIKNVEVVVRHVDHAGNVSQFGPVLKFTVPEAPIEPDPALDLLPPVSPAEPTFISLQSTQSGRGS